MFDVVHPVFNSYPSVVWMCLSYKEALAMAWHWNIKQANGNKLFIMPTRATGG
jgi:hypothetical protein